MNMRDELRLRAEDYTAQHQLTIVEELGFGVHGSVFIAKSQPGPGRPARQSAIKAHQHEEYYIRERDIYLRLQRRKLTRIRGCEVPKLLRYDDLLLIL